MPDYDEQGKRITYGLYREDSGKKEHIPDSYTLAQARINAQDVYIANVSSPWWQATPPANASPSLPGTSPLPRRRLPVSLAPVSPTTYACRLQLAPNCMVVVQGDYLELNRNYLSDKLPSTVVLAEKARVFSGYDSRLMRVSRARHCDIYRQDDCWYVRAHKPTYVNGHVLDKGKISKIQPPGTTIVLGQDGWPIIIELVAT
ncbi:FHA domain-containing protein [Roseiflexus sp.]|uniref:FHA domain-containing protein n=1 Tax=Roseiflexus sp. TaxID=2562120 RepID=UPI00398AEB98